MPQHFEKLTKNAQMCQSDAFYVAKAQQDLKTGAKGLTTRGPIP